MRTSDFHYELPGELIAQEPAPERDQSRLLVLHRSTGEIEHRRFPDLIRYLDPGDLLVLNNSRVLPARLRGAKAETAGSVELLLVEELAINRWRVMLRPGKRVRPGTRIHIHDRTGALSGLSATVRAKNEEGHCEVEFSGTAEIRNELEKYGDIPLPPYIGRAGTGASELDFQRYQTVFAKDPGSVAAPTAGLHFTPEYLARLGAEGVKMAEVTLHVGLGTFAPVKFENLEKHPMHEEHFEIPPEAVTKIEQTQAGRKRVVAVGTTAFRVIESAAEMGNGRLKSMRGGTRLFVYPPYHPRVVDCLLTNFHLPESTLLMLVSAFASPGNLNGRELVLRAYQEAIREKYRFFSYGDAMLIL